MPKLLKHESDRCIPVGLSLPKSVLESIDEDRGHVKRSTWIQLAILKALKHGRRTR